MDEELARQHAIAQGVLYDFVPKRVIRIICNCISIAYSIGKIKAYTDFLNNYLDNKEEKNESN